VFVRRTLVTALGALAVTLASPVALAQNWPTQPLRIIVPNVPGGSSDIIARVISQPLSAALGVPVVVENKPGANGNIGAAAVAQATDGNTILLCDLPSLAISPAIYKSMPYDLGKDLQGVAMLVTSAHLFVEHVGSRQQPEFVGKERALGEGRQRRRRQHRRHAVRRAHNRLTSIEITSWLTLLPSASID